MSSKHKRFRRGRLPDPLQSLLRLYGYNWRPQKSWSGKFWTVYKRGQPIVQGVNRFELHQDTPIEDVLWWVQRRENGQLTSNTITRLGAGT